MLILDLPGKFYTYSYSCFLFGPASSRFFLAERGRKGERRAREAQDDWVREAREGSMFAGTCQAHLTSLLFYSPPRRLAFPNYKGLKINSFSRAKQRKKKYENPGGGGVGGEGRLIPPIRAFFFAKSVNPPFAKEIGINTASGCFRKFLRHPAIGKFRAVLERFKDLWYI